VLGEIYPIAFMLFFGGVMQLVGRPLQLKPDQTDRDSLVDEVPGLGRALWAAVALGLAAMFALAALLPWVGRRAIVEWLGL
jgi:hypothetical protein